MFCKKVFSRILFSLFAFNALSGVVFTSAMENEIKCEYNKSKQPDQSYSEKYLDWLTGSWCTRKPIYERYKELLYEDWCGSSYPYDKLISKSFNSFGPILEQHQKLFTDCGIKFKENIREIYEKIFRAAFDGLNSNKEFPVSSGCLEHPQVLGDILGADWEWFRTGGAPGFNEYSYRNFVTYRGTDVYLVFTITFAKTLYSVDLKLESF